MGQSSAKASVSVTIMEPAGVQKLQDLNFGNFTMEAKPGAIELTSSGYRNGKGRVHFCSDSTKSVALFQILNNQAYSVTLPSTITVTKKNGMETMIVGSFMLHTKENRNASTQTLAVGATLYADDFQAAGEYIATTPLTVTINYN